jgi:hypothetical protein
LDQGDHTQRDTQDELTSVHGLPPFLGVSHNVSTLTIIARGVILCKVVT